MGLLVTLAVTVVMSGRGAWVGASQSGQTATGNPVPEVLAASAKASDAILLPAPRLLSIAVSDPFEIAPPPPPPAAKSKPAAPAAEPPAPPPPMNWRYLGQMTSPDNQRQIFLTKGDQAVPIEAGQRLGDGFTVDAVTLESVRLRHMDYGVQYLISLPEPSSQGSPQ